MRLFLACGSGAVLLELAVEKSDHSGMVCQTLQKGHACVCVVWRVLGSTEALVCRTEHCAASPGGFCGGEGAFRKFLFFAVGAMSIYVLHK